VPHVVTSNLKASAEAPHRAGVHGSEAAKLDGLGKPELLSRCLHMPVKQVKQIDQRWISSFTSFALEKKKCSVLLPRWHGNIPQI
jgi:hypothetical protein